MRLFSSTSGRTVCLLSCLLPALASGQVADLSDTAANAPQPSTPLSWETLAEDLDDFLEWSEDPLADLGWEPPAPSAISHGGSLRIGPGHSDNYLKRFHPTAQDFTFIEGDLFLNALLPASSLTLLLFGEWTGYRTNGPADAESLAFALLEWSLPTLSGSRGLRLSSFYGDQIYDASLSIQAPPLGTTFRQVRPEIALFLKHEFSDRDAMEVALAVRGARFDDPQNDHQRLLLEVDWTHTFSVRWRTSTRFTAYREEHRLATSRQRNSLPSDPASSLRINGAEWAQQLTAQLPWGKSLLATLEAGANLELDPVGEYDDLYRVWTGLQVQWKWKKLSFEAATRWQETRYDKRQIAFLDPRALLLQYRSAECRATYALSQHLALIGRWEWLDSYSRIDTDRYSEQRGQLLLEWSY
jgi:hypothetical protein